MIEGAESGADLGDRETLRRAKALVFVEDLDAIELSPADAHHLGQVLRLRAGEVVAVADGKGSFKVATVDGASQDRKAKGTFHLVADGEVRRTPRRDAPLSIAFALQKGDRAEWTVEKLTEIGIDVIVPITTKRTVVRLDAAGAKKRGERLRKTAAEAAMQARRPMLPLVSDPVSFDEFIEGLGPNPAGRVAIAEPGAPSDVSGLSAIAVGPEGGWDPDELAKFERHVGLGEHVLRAETAAMLAGQALVAKDQGR